MKKGYGFIGTIDERIKNMQDDEMAALFLVPVETGDGWDLEHGGIPDEGQVKRTLARFFRETDIIGSLEEGRFIVFLQGKISESVVRGKADMLCDALGFAEEEFSNVKLTDQIGIYFFRDPTKNFADALEKAEYAVQLAKMDASDRYYVYFDPNVDSVRLWGTREGISAQNLEYHPAENVRVLEVGEAIRPMYSGPSGSKPCEIDARDRELYERTVREAVQKGEAECRCRVSGDGIKRAACRFRFLRIQQGEERPALVLEMIRNPVEVRSMNYQRNLYLEWLSFVLKHSSFLLWDVEIKTRQFRMFYMDGRGNGPFDVYENFPDSLIENGRVHEDSAADFRRFAQNLLNGEPGDSGNFILRHRMTKIYSWCTMSYTMIFDEKGRPVRALGIKENISEFSRGKSGAVYGRTIPESVYPSLYCYLQANLAADLVEKLQVEGNDYTRKEEYQRYTSFLKNGINRIFPREEEERLQRRFGRRRLLTAFEQGRRWLVENLRFVDAQGRIRRGLVGVNLSKGENTGEVFLYAYFCVMDQKWAWETGMPFAVSKDLKTGLWTKTSVRAAASYMMSRPEAVPGAVCLIRIEGLKGLFDGKRWEKEKVNIGAAFSVLLGTGCFAGWQSEDSIAAYLPSERSQQSASRKLQSILASARLSLKGVPELQHLRFIAGVVLGGEAGGDYDKMLESAIQLCQLHSTDAADTVVFSEGSQVPVWKEIGLGGEHGGDISRESTDVQSKLNDEEKDMALECMDILLKPDPSANPVEKVLEKLGEYYAAERAYILTFSKKDNRASIFCEWCKEGKIILRNAVYGKYLNDFPVFRRCIAEKEREPLFLSRHAESAEGGKAKEKNGTWKYFVFPMKAQPDLYSFFCIENPEKGEQRMALVKKLLRYLEDWSLRERSAEGAAQMEDSSQVLFPGLRSYMDAIYSLDSSMYSAMGVLAVDIPQRPGLETQEERDGVSRFELRASELLTDIFGSSLLFHTQRAEFVVLCVNITYEVFIARCNRVRKLLEEQFPGQFRLGQTWSDGVFNARDLVDNARNLMYCENGTAEWTLIKNEEGNPPVRAEKRRKSVGKFTIYLQPKVDIRTGALVGAEALVRVMDSDGELLPHGKIIDQMEKEGTIQELDYFVFDRALSVISQWKRKNFRLFPISTNFSRKTLLNPTSLASLLAILSRYPEVPLDGIEMEITETAGDFENNTFSSLIEHFREYGFQFALDDFGSKYSNMSMLSEIHFHSVKLDRSMIRGVTGNQISQMMIKNIVRICHRTGMICIAEGVETQEQASALLKAGCTYAQGYYYGRPMPVQEFEELYLKKSGSAVEAGL